MNYISKIPNVSIKDGKVFYEWKTSVGVDKHDLIKLPKQVVDDYEEAMNKKAPLGYRIKKFLTANNKAGRQAKIVKDFALIFFPWGDKVGDITELITKQIKRTMPQTKQKTRSRTIRTFGLLFFAGIAMQLGWIPDTLALSPDAQWVLVGTSVLGVLFRLITGKPVELGPALTKVIGILKDE